MVDEPEPIKDDAVEQTPHHGLDSQIDEIEKRAKTIRARSPIEEPPEWKLDRTKPDIKKTEGSAMNYRGIGIGITAGYSLVGPIIVGYGIGWFIDSKHPGSTNAQVIGAIIGVVMGFITFLVMMMKLTASGRDS